MAVTPATIPGQKKMDKGPGPDTRAGAMANPETDPTLPTTLLPGESEIETRDDPYYGKVEKGIPPLPYNSLMPEPSIEGLERDIEEGRTFLTGEQQARVEVLTGKRLQAGAENFKAAREKRMAERPSAKPVPGEGDAPSDRPQPTKEARP